MLRAAMLYALSTGHKIGLASTGAAFILFALISSFVLPRMNANFPGRGLKLYLVVCVAFFAAMITAVLVFDKEKKAAAAVAPTTTTTTPTAVAAGNAAAGKPVFTTAGCGACHTFTPAAATGKLGPDLNNLAAYAKKAGVPLAQFTEEAITKPPAPYVPPGFPTNVMPTTFGASLTKTQLADLVAFLAKP
jgi:cytochrome c551/c552